MENVRLTETRTVHASEIVRVASGAAQVVIELPEEVPAGKVLNLRVEVSGSYQDAEPQGE